MNIILKKIFVCLVLLFSHATHTMQYISLSCDENIGATQASLQPEPTISTQISKSHAKKLRKFNDEQEQFKIDPTIRFPGPADDAPFDDNPSGFSINYNVIENNCRHHTTETNTELRLPKKSIQKLFMNCATTDNRDGLQALAQDPHVDINKPIKLNADDTLLVTPLYQATTKKKMRSIHTLLQLGANPDLGIYMQHSIKGWTPLHHAAEKGYIITAKKLIKAGAIINAKDPKGRTPRYYAHHHKHHALETLLKKEEALARLLPHKRRK